MRHTDSGHIEGYDPACEACLTTACLTTDTVTPFTQSLTAPKKEPFIVGSVSAHYTVRSAHGSHEVGDIHCLHDAILFAKALAEEFTRPYYVIEHKFTETTIAVYGNEHL